MTADGTIPSRSSLHRYEIGLHRHESFFQILYISTGSGDALFANERLALSPGAVVTVPPALGHGFRFLSYGDSSVLLRE